MNVFGNFGNHLVTEKKESVVSIDILYIYVYYISYQVTRLPRISYTHARMCARTCDRQDRWKLGNLVTGAFLRYLLAVSSGYQMVTYTPFEVT